MSEKIDIKSLTLEELKAELAKKGEKPFRAQQMYEWMHVKLARGFDEMTNLSKNLRAGCEEWYTYTSLTPVQVQESKIDGTKKFLFGLADGNVVESVWMKYQHGNSVCISSQVGCRMGCSFCASTLDGLERNLTPSEMLDQIYAITGLTGERVSNVVVMGTGEPMDNYDNLLRFLKLLTDENGLHISQRNVTVSTCGIVPRMRQLAEEHLQITLALSLHAATDEKRRRLMPIANRYSIKELMEACAYYFEQTGRRITFEYSLVGGINDRDEDARELIALARPLCCHVNLIPVNPIKERDYVQSDKDAIQRFKSKLEKNKITVTIRREMGRDIDGACGQLRRRHMGNSASKEEEKSVLKAFAITDIGKKRKLNQDFVFASEQPVGNLPNLFIVADGMGGHNAGDYASKYTVETVVEEAAASPEKLPVKILRQAIETANDKIRQKANEDQNLTGMGTTVVAASCQGNVLDVANVGDSRLYIINDTINQVTRDHSLVEEMVRLGGIDREEARNHPEKNIITRAIGACRTVDVDFFSVELTKADMILMCSDGLTNMLTDEEIFEIIHSNEDIRSSASALVKAANDNGGKDNIAVILIEPLPEIFSVRMEK